MHSNHISLDGNNNIVIQEAQGSHIYVNSEEGVRQLLAEQGDEIKQILEHLQAQPEPVLQQFAQKIYQIGQIENAHFHIYGERTIKKHLTPPPFIPELFLGREVDLKTVHQKLFRGDNLLLLVNGQGGIGKTTLAAKYWEAYQDQYSHVAWVFAGNSLLDALLTLAQELALSFPEAMPNVERLPLLLKALSNLNKPCLLVIDNANDLEDLENHYLALRSCSNFHLLLTTRITEFEQAAFHQIQPLESKVAIDLFQTHYPKYQASDQPLMDQILGAVGHNTLVIELLAKKLRNLNKLREQYSLADLLQDLQGKGLLALGKSAPVKVGYQASVLALRQETPEAIIAAMYDLGELSAGEKQLMSVFAVLPAERIEFRVLEELLPETAELDSDLLALAQKGWLDYDEAGASFKISPVVQEIVRKKNETLSADCEGLIEALNEKLRYEPTTGHFLNASYSEAAVFARYGEMLVGCFEEADNGLAVLCERLGSFHRTRGNLAQALQFFEQYNQLSQELFEAYPGNVAFKKGLAITYQFLGQTHADLGNLAQALRFFEQFNQLSQELVEAYPHKVDFKNGLAISYEKSGQTHASLGNLAQALRFFETETQLFQELVEAYPDNVDFKNGLAIAYQFLGQTNTSLGNLAQAQRFFEQYYQLERQLFETYPDNVAFKNELAISHLKLGQTHVDLGNLAQALSFFETETQLFKELFEAYPDNVAFKNGLAISYSKLGQTHASLGNLARALPFLKQFNQLELQLFGAYPDNVGFKNSLAVSYTKLGMIHLLQADLIPAQVAFASFYQYSEELYEQAPDNIAISANYAEAMAIVAALRLLQGDDALSELDTAKQHFDRLHQLSERDYFAQKSALVAQMQVPSADMRALIIALSKF